MPNPKPTAEPTDAELIAATKEVVRSLKRDGTIEKWTKGLLRERMEKHFNLPSGSLRERRKLVEQATAEAIEESDDEDKDDEQVEDSKKKQTKPSSPKRPSNKKKRPSTELASDSELSVLDDGSPAKSKKSKGKEAKPSSSKKKVSATTKAKRADKNTDTFLSMIGLAPGSKGADENAAALLVQGLTGGKASLDDDDNLSELEDQPPRKKAKTKRTSDGGSKGKAKSKKAAAESVGVTSECQLRRLSLINYLSQGSASEEDPAPKKRSRKDKNEEEIKRLKSFVLACGVRKKWVKEFEGLDTSAQQINKLRKILADLGMTGRLSLEKAKEIREKREFAQEMEDIQEFNAKINGPRASRSSRNRGKPGSDNDEEMKNGDDGEDDSPGPSMPRKKGRSTLLAFLDDQSESE
ncbi:hypothetical protein FRC00_003146 [Tulasnella sp. 408]|nr:hypothetical protein FRC00_003146 [Tulasnella sp. 408]